MDILDEIQKHLDGELRASEDAQLYMFMRAADEINRLRRIEIDVTSANQLLTYKSHIAKLRRTIEEFLNGEAQREDLTNILEQIPHPFQQWHGKTGA